jgi:hypothetical protein
LPVVVRLTTRANMNAAVACGMCVGLGVEGVKGGGAACRSRRRCARSRNVRGIVGQTICPKNQNAEAICVLVLRAGWERSAQGHHAPDHEVPGAPKGMWVGQRCTGVSAQPSRRIATCGTSNVRATRCSFGMARHPGANFGKTSTPGFGCPVLPWGFNHRKLARGGAAGTKLLVSEN